MDRREAIKSLLRGLILILLGTITWFGFKNNKIANIAVCDKNYQCSNCNKFSNCTLPKTEKKQQDGRR